MNETLILVPTELERRRLAQRDGCPFHDASLCGFGPVAAAARTSMLLAESVYDRVLLVGIAGVFDGSVGDATCFANVTIDGIGKGQAPAFVSANEMGFPHWPGGHGVGCDRIGDAITLDNPTANNANLLTVCAASANPDDATTRRERYPDVTAEDMEGFGVAMACAMKGVPLTIVRGFSNTVGNADSKTWRIDEALDAARSLATQLISKWNDQP